MGGMQEPGVLHPGGWSEPGDFPVSLIPGRVGRGEGRDLRGPQAWVLGVWRGGVLGQHMCRHLGNLVGRQSSGPAHNPTRRLGFRRLGCGSQVFRDTGTVD